MSNKLGHYAWKSAIISKEVSLHSGLVLWFDTGNLINKKLTYLRITLSAFGFYSHIAMGTFLTGLTRAL